MIMLKVDKSNSEHDEHKDEDESSQQALLFDKGIADVFTNQLALVNKILPPQNGLQKLKLSFFLIIISLL